jgi:hypothetical protein
VRIELRVAPAALQPGREAARGAKGGHQPDRERHRHLEVPGRGMAGMPRLDKAHHPFAQVQRVGLGHPISSAGKGRGE